MSNCTITQAQADHFGDPLALSISVTGSLLNVLVIFVIFEAMRQRRTYAQTHLMALAFSDLAVGVLAICLGIFSRSCDLCIPCSQAKSCFYGFRIVFSFFLLSGGINRSMTLCISFTRAQSIKNATNAIKNENDKKQGRVLMELLGLTAIVTVATVMILVLGMFFIPKFVSLPRFVIFDKFFIVYLFALILVELLLAFFVLIKLRIHKRSVLRDGSASPMNDDFEKLVALVALVFCCTHFVSVIDFVLCLDDHDELEWRQSLGQYWTTIATIFNSSVNLIVYAVASKRFRTAGQRLGKYVLNRS